MSVSISSSQTAGLVELPDQQHASSVVLVHTYADLPNAIRSIVHSLNRFDNASTPQEIEAALANYDDDVVYDAPLLWIQGKERIKAVGSLLGFFGKVDNDILVVRTSLHEGIWLQLEIEKKSSIIPKRYWWLPPTMFIPELQGLYSTDILTVKNWNGRIAYIKGRYHNTTAFMPWIARYTAGWIMGNGVWMAEPLTRNSFRAWHTAVETWTSWLKPYLQRKPLSSFVEKGSELIQVFKDYWEELMGGAVQ